MRKKCFIGLITAALGRSYPTQIIEKKKEKKTLALGSLFHPSDHDSLCGRGEIGKVSPFVIGNTDYFRSEGGGRWELGSEIC